MLRFTHRLLLLSTLTTVLLGSLLLLIALFELFGSDFFHQWMIIDTDGSISFEITSSDDTLPTKIENSVIATVVHLIFFLFTWLMVQLNALKVFRALKDSETFHLNSIKALRTVGFWLFIITAIELVQFQWFDNTFQMTFNFEFTYLIAACSAIVLAQIFKEGNELAESNRLTI